MSSVTEQRHSPGGFQIDMAEDTPPSLLRQLSLSSIGFGILVVTPQRVEPASFVAPSDPEATAHPLLGVARYAGVIRRTANRFRTIEGDGLLSLLGDQSQAAGSALGQWSQQMSDGRVIRTMAVWANLLLVGGTVTTTDGTLIAFPTPHLRLGSISAQNTFLARMSGLQTYRWLLNEACWQTGHHYRVDPNGRVYIGSRADVYGSTPRTILGANLPDDNDPQWITIRAALNDWGESVEDYITGTVGDPPAQAGTFTPDYFLNDSGTAHFQVPTRNYPHNPFLHVGIDAEEDRDGWNDRTDWIVADRNRITYTATFSGAMTPTVRLIPGEPMYLWDPEIGLTGTSTVYYSGQEIRPQRVDLAAYTWPITPEMGVYILTHRSGATTILDLSEHVAFTEDPLVSIELGQRVTPL